MKYMIANIYDYNNEELNNIKNKLNENEKNEISKINNITQIKRKIISKKLLIKGLNNYYSIDYNNLKIITNKNGKPYILNKNIYFNISHSFNYCICAFSNKKIGIDIEKIRKANLKVINFFSTENEKEYIFMDKENIYQRLFEIFTLKEAYFKMKGENLDNIKNIEFKIENDIVACSDKNVIAKIIRNIDNYIIAICEKK